MQDDDLRHGRPAEHHGCSKDALAGLRWVHADIFSATALSGNGLCVFPDADRLSGACMQSLTRELRQFESIFLTGRDSGLVRARIFTVDEELAFAGHPILGAAAVLHDLASAPKPAALRIEVGGRAIAVTIEPTASALWAEMDQGAPEFTGVASPADAAPVLDGLGLEPSDQAGGWPLASVSTGLPYAIVPVTAAGLTKARIRCADFEARLAPLAAKFAYLLDPSACEGRSWDNAGRDEDVATGSAAGPAAAYLRRYGEAPERMTIRQGRFLGRPSEITVRCDPAGSVFVGGEVAILAEGRFR